MNKITKEEKVKIFDDLIKYYRFCKSDRRNHIFNAIYAAKKYRKRGASKQELDELEKSFQEAKNSYSYYSRMKVVALLLKLNLNDFITQEEKKQAIEDLLSHYDWRIKTCLFHIQASEKSLEKYRESKDINDVKFRELEIRLLDDKEEYSNYLEKKNFAKCFKNEIIILTGKEVLISFFANNNIFFKYLLAFNLTYMYINTALKNKSTNKKFVYMEKIVKIPNAVSTFIVENGARVQEKGNGVVNIKLKPGTSEPVEIITDILARLVDANPDLIITAKGITPVPSPGGVVFYCAVDFTPCSKFFPKI